MGQQVKLDLQSIIEATRAAANEQQLFDYFSQIGKEFGFDSVGFILARSGLVSGGGTPAPVTHTFPEDFIRIYVEHDYFGHDPLIKAVALTAQPFNWYTIGDKYKLSERAAMFLDELKMLGYKDGLTIPVHTMGGQVISFNFGARDGKIDLSPIEFALLQSICTQIYHRYQELQEAHKDSPPELTEREVEVLHWAAQGKSNNDIADILSISAHTVDTLLRRVFAKLNVTNRIAAVLKGIGFGLIRP